MNADDVNGGLFISGDEIEYTVRITNLSAEVVGGGSGNEVQVPLPAGASFVEGSVAVDGVSNDDDTTDGIGYDVAGNRIMWNGVIPPGSVRLLTYRLRSEDSLSVGDRLVSQAEILGGLMTDDPSTNLAGDATSLTIASEEGGAITPNATPAVTPVPPPTETPEPAVTPMPTNTPTPTPTATPRPTVTPRPTATIAPTDAPTPSATAVPTATPVPVATRTPPTIAPVATIQPEQSLGRLARRRSRKSENSAPSQTSWSTASIAVFSV